MNRSIFITDISAAFGRAHFAASEDSCQGNHSGHTQRRVLWATGNQWYARKSNSLNKLFETFCKCMLSACIFSEDCILLYFDTSCSFVVVVVVVVVGGGGGVVVVF